MAPALEQATPVDLTAVLYGGTCTRCGSAHHLGCTEQALAAARSLVADLEQHQRLDYASPHANPAFHCDMLFTKGPGRMLGVLVGHKAASGEAVVLKAFSGQIGDTWYIPGWVGPVCTLTSSTQVYQQTRRVTEQVSARISSLQLVRAAAGGGVNPHGRRRTQQQQQQRKQRGLQHPTPNTASNAAMLIWVDSQLQLLKDRRKGISHQLLQQIQASYATQDVLGRPLDLLDVYLSYHTLVNPTVKLTRAGAFIGFPAGTGDCCAPKLLHAAALAGVQPTGLLEFWYGSAPGTATPAKAGRQIPAGGLSPDSSRQHAAVYGMCEKCEAILGTMLCSCLFQ
jgi:tRNA pseudouridine32 synthase/23S rRNA pseudouridine746 synthase